MIFIENVFASEAEISQEATSSAGEGILSSLGVNAPLFAFQLLNFAIVFVILWFLILKPLSKKLTERQKMIDDSIENSKKIDEILKQGEKKYQDRIDVAKAEANAILERAKIESDFIAEEAKNKTKGDMEVLVAQAKARISSEKDNMIAGLKNETAGLVVTALQQILGEKIDANKDKKIISDALSKLDYEKK
ncbi:MAG: F0F1 ATP synthase subunit B [Candidatus Magasanikbacteria bacterium]|nr:F0F1 ATP synthase subunit B [Candidatus Magasanikbacteria bacterium]